jgi:hypothetical protein
VSENKAIIQTHAFLVLRVTHGGEKYSSKESNPQQRVKTRKGPSEKSKQFPLSLEYLNAAL